MDMPMQYFVFSTTHIYLLFRPWYITTTWQYVLSFIGVFVGTLLFEYLKIVQTRLARFEQESNRSVSPLQVNNPGEEARALLHSERRYALHLSPETRFCDMSLALRFAKSLLHGVQIAFSYFFMVVVMTFNAGLLIAIVAGATVGYFCFACAKQRCPPQVAEVDLTQQEEAVASELHSSAVACH